MNIDLERIKARAEAATPIVLIGTMVSKNNAEFLKSAKGDVLALIAEVEQLQEKYNDLNTRYNILFTAFNKEIAETERLQSDLDRVTAERDAAVEDLHHCENACEYCANAYRCNQNECSILDTQTGECVDAWKWRGKGASKWLLI